MKKLLIDSREWLFYIVIVALALLGIAVIFFALSAIFTSSTMFTIAFYWMGAGIIALLIGAIVRILGD